MVLQRLQENCFLCDTYFIDIHATHSEMKSFSVLHNANSPIKSNVTYFLRQLVDLASIGYFI